MNGIIEILVAAEPIKPVAADQVITVLSNMIQREQFDVVGEALDWIWHGGVCIEWTSAEGRRIAEWVADWIANICADMYKDAVDTIEQNKILKTSFSCMKSRTHSLKEICMMYHEFKRKECEILLEACGLNIKNEY